MATVLDLIEEVHGQSGWAPQVLSPGGGWGVAYHEDDLPHPTIEEYVAFVAHELAEGCRSRNLPLPRLQLEPGRSIVARAGVAIYRVGAVKCTPNRRWLLLDGGMADNPRPALYGARYSALPVAAPGRPLAGPAWLAGPYCESGDVLIRRSAAAGDRGRRADRSSGQRRLSPGDGQQLQRRAQARRAVAARRQSAAHPAS